MADGPAEFGESISPYQGVADRFYKDLEVKGIAFAPEKYEGKGVLAIGGTNESGNPRLFEKLRGQSPDGYLIGIGAANVFSMLEAFPEGSEPKSILLFDIDPQVIGVGQSLIDHFKESGVYPQAILGDPQLDGYYKNTVFPEGMGVQFKNALRKYGPLLHKLAKEGRFGIARVNFTDPRLMEEISRLPDLKNSNNVVYLSNISDHIWRANQANVPDFSFLNVLSPNPPSRNYYIDTLLKGLGYRLRVSTQVPHFELVDFSNSGDDMRFQTKLTDEIEGTKENLLWEDISSWDLQRLLDEYGKFAGTEVSQHRRSFVQRRISEGRQWALDDYPKSKAQSGKIIEIGSGILELRKVPESVEEETALLDELALPYNYDIDFIPFLARNFWADAKIPDQIDFQRILKKENTVQTESSTGRRVHVYDVSSAKKGKIELGFLADKVPLEELALAKIYREVEKRLLARNPGAKTEGKDINRLSQELQFGKRVA